MSLALQVHHEERVMASLGEVIEDGASLVRECFVYQAEPAGGPSAATGGPGA